MLNCLDTCMGVITEMRDGLAGCSSRSWTSSRPSSSPRPSRRCPSRRCWCCWCCWRRAPAALPACQAGSAATWSGLCWMQLTQRPMWRSQRPSSLTFMLTAGRSWPMEWKMPMEKQSPPHLSPKAAGNLVCDMLLHILSRLDTFNSLAPLALRALLPPHSIQQRAKLAHGASQLRCKSCWL